MGVVCLFFCPVSVGDCITYIEAECKWAYIFVPTYPYCTLSTEDVLSFNFTDTSVNNAGGSYSDIL